MIHSNNPKIIEDGLATLGIEFGSTRIKAILLDSDNMPISYGIHQWESVQTNGLWTYSESAIWEGLRACYFDLKSNVLRDFGLVIHQLKAIGLSGMMHGYIALDQDDNLLVPFRTWRNTTTFEASKILKRMFFFSIPQRWSIAHLYQAVLSGEEHVKNIRYLTTLSGFIHLGLTGERVLGIGEASGVFPIDSDTKTYHASMMKTFNAMIENEFPWKLEDILPKIMIAGEQAGFLTRSGSFLIDPSGDLEPGIPFCPPEGDAGTGMVATNSIKKRTGNISAGTSIFGMIVLERPLSKPYDAIDIVATPEGQAVAMVHANNCSSDLNAWIDFAYDLISSFSIKIDREMLFHSILNTALKGDRKTGNLLSYNYFSGEHITEITEGRPILVRKPDSLLNVANLVKASLFSAFAVLKIGLDILFKSEGIKIDRITAHGGLFKTPVVAQRILSSIINSPIIVMNTAGEGGSYGIAILANYMIEKAKFNCLQDYLDVSVFSGVKSKIEFPVPELSEDFQEYFKRYISGLNIVREAINSMK